MGRNSPESGELASHQMWIGFQSNRDVGLGSEPTASPLTIGRVHQQQRSRWRRQPVRYKNLNVGVVDPRYADKKLAS